MFITYTISQLIFVKIAPTRTFYIINHTFYMIVAEWMCYFCQVINIANCGNYYFPLFSTSLDSNVLVAPVLCGTPPPPTMIVIIQHILPPPTHIYGWSLSYPPIKPNSHSAKLKQLKTFTPHGCNGSPSSSIHLKFLFQRRH